MQERPGITLELKRREVFYAGTLGQPAFGSLPSEGRIYAAIYDRFAGHGAQLSDIRLDAVAMSPGEASVSCNLHRLNVRVRYSLERVELWWGGEGVPNLPVLTEAAIAALKDVSPQSALASQLVTITAHGEVLKGNLDEWLRASVIAPSAGDDLLFTPNGLSFATTLSEGSGAFIVEKSSMLKGGAFVRVTRELPGSTPCAEATKRAAELLSTALKVFGMSLNFDG